MRLQRRLVATSGQLLVVAALAAFVPSLALADSPSNGQLLVPGDHHLPGESLEVTGYALDPGMALQLTLVNGSNTVSLGTATVLDDGTFSVPASVPATFPTGYAEVVATSSGGGNTWQTVILVGERAEGPKPVDPAAASTDTSTLGLVMIAIGLAIFLVAAAWYLRGRLRFGR